MKEPETTQPSTRPTDTSIPLRSIVSLSHESSSILVPTTSWVSSGPTETGDTPALPPSDSAFGCTLVSAFSTADAPAPRYSSKHPPSAGRNSHSETIPPGIVACTEGPRQGEPSESWSFVGYHDGSRNSLFPLEEGALNFRHPERRTQPFDSSPSHLSPGARFARRMRIPAFDPNNVRGETSCLPCELALSWAGTWLRRSSSPRGLDHPSPTENTRQLEAPRRPGTLSPKGSFNSPPRISPGHNIPPDKPFFSSRLSSVKEPSGTSSIVRMVPIRLSQLPRGCAGTGRGLLLLIKVSLFGAPWGCWPAGPARSSVSGTLPGSMRRWCHCALLKGMINGCHCGGCEGEDLSSPPRLPARPKRAS